MNKLTHVVQGADQFSWTNGKTPVKLITHAFDKGITSNVLKTLYWTYHPSAIDPNLFDPLYAEVKDLCEKSYTNRINCILKDIPSRYEHNYPWQSSPTAIAIKHQVEEIIGDTYDYCLVNIYRDGNDCINYHNDSEALNSSVASVSLGAQRKFRFRPIASQTGWTWELELESGDLVFMHGPNDELKGCQRVFKHSVPKQKKVKNPRINLTFRCI